MSRWLAPLIVVLLLSVSSSAPAQAQACQPYGDPAREVSFSGGTNQNTRPITLAPGNYVIRWSASANSQYGGNVIMDLKRADGQHFPGGNFVNMILNKERPTDGGETFVYGVQPGPHYVEIMAPGPWSVTISPI
jgi:hypothetical protein